MKIISRTNPISLRRYVCDFCGEYIPQNTKYCYIKHRLSGKIENLKVHSSCNELATNLSLIERDNISKYTFRKKLVDYIVNLHLRGGKRVKKKTVESYPISHLVDIANKYFTDEVKNSNISPNNSVSHGVLKEIISLYITLFMMPMVMDDLIYELEEKNQYKHKTKVVLKQILQDFENMGTALSRLYCTKTSMLDSLVSHSMEIYDEIQQSISLDGLERSANILTGLIDVIGDKYEKISKEVNVRVNIKNIIDIKFLLKQILKFNKHKFVHFIVSDKCSSKQITLTE